MHSFRASLAVLLAAALLASPVFAATAHRTTKTASAPAHSAHARKAAASRSKRKTKKSRLHGQQAIEPERVTQIQAALIHSNYLTGDASGQWDETTQAAMRKYQADHGWQTKLTPDSRALKALGLGPDYSNALNAENATFGPPAPTSTIPADETAGFAASAGVNQ